MQIYLDHNASTPISPDVAEAMRPWLQHDYGNPSSGHWASVNAASAVARARVSVAAALGCRPREVVFTSGGSESNNWAIKGVVSRAAHARRPARPHAVISAVEHPSVSQPCRYLERAGLRTTEVRVDRHGMVDPDDVRRAITPDTVLVSVMHANNEVGTIQPIPEISAITRERGVPLHTDAAQTMGKITVAVDTLGVDLLTIAGHKLGGPKGVGALFVRDGVELDPLIHGGGHELGRRAGTENVLLVVGLGAAAESARLHPCEAQLHELAHHLWSRIHESFGERVELLGHPQKRLPNTVNIAFIGESGRKILSAIPTVAASTGSACDAGTETLSPVLSAMGVTDEVGRGAVRFSLGRTTTREELDVVVDRLREVV